MNPDIEPYVDDAVRMIAGQALGIVRPLLVGSKAKMLGVYLESNEVFANCEIWAYRKGSGFLGMGGAQQNVDFMIVVMYTRPGVFGPDWAQYQLTLLDVETGPNLDNCIRVMGFGEATDLTLPELAIVKQRLTEMLQLPVTPGNTVQTPREVPERLQYYF